MSKSMVRGSSIVGNISLFGRNRIMSPAQLNVNRNLTRSISDMKLLNDKELFPDLPSGCLDRYRKIASFDYRKLALALENEEFIRCRNKIWKDLENNPLFARSNKELTMDEQRELAVKRQYDIFPREYITLQEQIINPELMMTALLSLIAYEPSFIIKSSLASGMFPLVLRTMGNNDYLQQHATEAEVFDIYGGFALTETSHGTNALGMRTTAHFDVATKEFIIHTPDFEAAKCWIGNLGKSTTHLIVYAQLYTPDGEHHGLNGFLVQVRDRKTHLPVAGVIVGDLGEKIGLNGLDNGFVLFNKCRIPRDSLLGKTGEITDDGKFVSKIKDKKKRMGASFGALSGGRVNICGISNTYLIKAISIAVRYSASRQQFGDEGATEELPVLEYQSQQYRILPHLATCLVQKVFTLWLVRTYTDIARSAFLGESNAAEVSIEMHAISSAVKPVCTWAVRDAIQDCREACGGHGYLKVAGFGDLRNDNDPNLTYEGENNVLLQQSSNWLLSIRKNGYAAFKTASPLKSAEFLSNFDRVIAGQFQYSNSQEALDPTNLLRVFDWLCAWLLESTYNLSLELKAKGKTPFHVRGDTQVFHAQSLSIIYGQRTIFARFIEYLSDLDDSAEKEVLQKLLSLYGANIILKNIGLLYEGGCISGNQLPQLYKQGAIQLMAELKNDAVSLIDTIAPTDFILNSPLGMSDGNVYKHIHTVLKNTPGTFERPHWWQLITNWKDNMPKNKL